MLSCWHGTNTRNRRLDGRRRRADSAHEPGALPATEKLEEFSSLAPDEGRVVKLNNEAMALYKDEHGSLHAVNPTCTHMKCSVAWNAAEKSWDCPCHGARYSIEGDVLNGPADANLELIELRSLLEKED